MNDQPLESRNLNTQTETQPQGRESGGTPPVVRRLIPSVLDGASSESKQWFDTPHALQDFGWRPKIARVHRKSNLTNRASFIPSRVGATLAVAPVGGPKRSLRRPIGGKGKPYPYPGCEIIFSDQKRPIQIPALRPTSYVLRVVVLLLVAGLILAPASLVAQSFPDAEVEFFVKSPEPDRPITVGDQVVLRLEIVHPADSRVVLPQLEETWEVFIVVDQSPPQTVERGDGSAVTGKDITVALFEPGDYETPLVVVTHRKPDGSIEELAAPIIPIHVTSVLTEESTLQELKPQVDLPEPLFWPWVLGGVVLALVLAGLLTALTTWLYRRWQKRPAPEFVPAPFIDTRPPEIIAHAELDRIEALDLPRRQEIKTHYSLVAVCLRRYIEGRYQIPAPEQTTRELRDAFRKSEVPMRDVNGLMGVITESDWVKFARYTPRPEEINSLVNKARTVIDATTPVVEEPEPPPPPVEKEEVAV